MNERNGHAELASTGAAKLTAKQERFAQLVALEGYKQSAAYRESHDVLLSIPMLIIWPIVLM